MRHALRVGPEKCTERSDIKNQSQEPRHAVCPTCQSLMGTVSYCTVAFPVFCGGLTSAISDPLSPFNLFFFIHAASEYVWESKPCEWVLAHRQTTIHVLLLY